MNGKFFEIKWFVNTFTHLCRVRLNHLEYPVLFVLGFIVGTTALHLLGVAIGHLSIKKTISLILLKLTGASFAIYGIYLLNEIF